MIHVAAQGDSPVSIAYFIQLGLDIESKDKRESTAVHWAAYSSCECVLNYLISWGANINAMDAKGLSPLHCAVKAYQNKFGTRTIKQLLIKGADRNALDHDNKRPCDYIPVP